MGLPATHSFGGQLQPTSRDRGRALFHFWGHRPVEGGLRAEQTQECGAHIRQNCAVCHRWQTGV